MFPRLFHLHQRFRAAVRGSTGLFLLFTLLLTACGSGGSSQPATSSAPGSSAAGQAGAIATAASKATASAGTTVTATANDFNFKFNTTTVPAGPIHFALDNQSKTYQHELVIYPQNQPRLQAMLTALDAGQTVNVSDYLQGIVVNIPPQDPGKSASADATLQPGTYDMACFVVTNIAGKNMVHYEMGMHDPLTVK
jgi:uncharacterized cupredoxin-like copper-binding protein